MKTASASESGRDDLQPETNKVLSGFKIEHIKKPASIQSVRIMQVMAMNSPRWRRECEDHRKECTL